MQTTLGLNRVVFFTDAVTAIAITLLILPVVDSVAAATNKGHSAGQFLADNEVQLVALALSFAVIARLWISHHSTFEHVAAYNAPLMLIHRHPTLEDTANPITARHVFTSIAVATAFVVAMVVGVLVRSINFWALLILFISIPVQMTYDRTAAAHARANEVEVNEVEVEGQSDAESEATNVRANGC